LLDIAQSQVRWLQAARQRSMPADWPGLSARLLRRSGKEIAPKCAKSRDRMGLGPFYNRCKVAGPIWPPTGFLLARIGRIVYGYSHLECPRDGVGLRIDLAHPSCRLHCGIVGESDNNCGIMGSRPDHLCGHVKDSVPSLFAGHLKDHLPRL